MRKIDYHIHTKFSADSEADPRGHILKAIEMGLDEICFTDHQDFNYPYMSFDLDIDSYLKEMKLLKEEYKNQIRIKIGVEVGLDLNYIQEINDFVNSHDFDYVIGSIHVIRNTEFYEPAEYFNNKTITISIKQRKKHIENSF